MKILLIGSGGREHALAWAITASPLCDQLICAPGNAGIAELAECVPVGIENIDGLVKLAVERKVDFVVVGPEGPLVEGVADQLRDKGFKVFGPSQLAAQLEGSKGFTKDICAKYNIPTGAYGKFTALQPALDYLHKQGAPIVVKADGLAAGKGVTVAMNVAEAEAALRACFDGQFGQAGAKVVIEEFLDGEEASFFALCDGTHAVALAAAQDHKRVGDGDTGPNTGGMGSYSPAPVLDETMAARVMREIIHPTLRGMAQEGCKFQGVLFAGLMIGKDGPKLIEYNVRFGDPECQSLMLRLKSDLLTALIASADGALKDFDLRWRDDCAITVVMAANGYPGDYQKNTEIKGLDQAATVPGVTIFHAGTKRGGDGRLLANGGRVLNISALGHDINEARARAYEAINRIDWPEGFCRRDIGWRALAARK
ncbi:MAG: phosphoribosylamine--glycine ligase [Rhodospirillales bacterium]